MITELTYKYYNEISGIYAIKSRIDERQYIGSAVNLHNRYCVHRLLLRENKHHSKHLQNFYNKYGGEKLEFNVLEVCPKDKLKIREQYYLDNVNKEFNNSPTATSNYGIKLKPLTEEHKRKISLSSRGHKKSEETRKRMSESLRKRKGLSEIATKMGLANRKIDANKREEIYKRYKSGGRVINIADEYNVCPATIYNAISAFEILEKKLC